MKFIPKQCRVCPFRPGSVQGWLGEYTPSQVFDSIWRGVPFFCHDSMDYSDPNWLEKAMSNPKAGKLCVGGLDFANRILAPLSMPGRDDYVSHPIVILGREKVKLIEGIECMDARDFLDHHAKKQ